MKSIRWKLVIMYIAIVFIVMISSGSFIIVSLRMNETERARTNLKYAAESLNDAVIRGNDDASEFRKWFENNTVSDSIERNILSADGRTLATSVTKDEFITKYPQYETAAVIAALKGEARFSASSRKYPDFYDREQRWFEYAMPVLSADGQTLNYVIYVRTEAETVYSNISQMTNTIALASVLALVATLIIGALFANSLTVPIAMLTKGAREFAEGKFEQEIVIGSKDEIGQLTESFNNMARDLAKNISEIVGEKNKMDIVQYNMTDGVLAYDKNGKVIHFNNACVELLDIKGIDKLSLPEMLKSLGIEPPEPFEQSSELDSIGDDFWRDTTVFIHDKYLNATFNPYKNLSGATEGIIIVLQDITKHMKLDNMRKEFVANVSHEIRTPLTTIKSYTETLIDGTINDPETALGFLHTINGEADRMMLIVKDLLELSKLDNNRMDLDLKELDLVSLVKGNVEKHAITAQRVNKTVTFNTAVENAVITADSERINQVINNIVSNSIKYSNENAVISVSLEDSDNYFRVYVHDNGIGIPKEDLRQIFERFYRVDKARSRAMGGTGLGLSIAKEIMESHGGKISVSSELGKGTTMILRFPKEFGALADDIYDTV